MRIEHWWYTVPLKLKSLLLRGRVEREMSDELQFHVEHKIEEGIAAGLSPEEARFAALRAMGGLEQHKEQMRDVRGLTPLTDFAADLRFAIRCLRRNGKLTGFVAITLAVGIGMAAAGFGMVDALIFRPYPVPQPNRIVNLVSTTHDNAFDLFSYREYLDLRDHTRSYDGVIANTLLGSVGFSAEREATPRIKGGMLVSGNYFRVLGVEPSLGRGFRDDEDEVPGRDAVVVLGREFWKHEFAADRSVIGRTVLINGTEFTVIGVTPEGFTGMSIFTRPDLYAPLAMARAFSTNPQKDFFQDRDDRELSVKGRLESGTTLEQARSELTAIAQSFERQHADASHDRGAAVRTQTEMRTQADDPNWKFSVIFAVLAMAVLLVACTNVAGLLLSRARARTREIAIRLALGAGRFRLVRLLLTESLILAILGGLGGIVVANVAVSFLQTFRIPSELPVTIPFRVDGRVLWAGLVLSFASALLCGLAPALQSTRADVASGLKAGETDEPGRRRLWGRNVLVVAQVSMSLMLLTASFLMARSFQVSVEGGAGFATDHLLMTRFDPRLLRYDAARTEQFYQLLTERVRALPGVLGVGLTRTPALGLDTFQRLAFVPDGFELPRDRENLTSATDTVDEGYFQAMGIPIQRGRGFRTSDRADAPRVAVVNEQFAKHYWPGADPVGKVIRLGSRGGTPVEIVGVAQTIKYTDTGERPMDFVYLPLAQNPMARMVLVVRTSGDPLQLVQPVKDVVKGLDPNLPMLETRSYEDLYRYGAVDGPRIAVELVGTMGSVALLLAIIGLYGLIAYNVSRRTREIGIRMAIGAAPRDVLRLVLGKGLVLVAAGMVIGLALGLGVEQMLDSMVFNTPGVDLLAYAMVLPAMFLVTLFAAYVPARRASRIAPTEALRYE